MAKGKIGAGLRSDGELVQGGADSFVFAPVREDAVGLLLPAVQKAPRADGDWIDIITMSPPPPPGDARAGGDDDDDDGLPPTLDWGIDGDGPGDEGHGGWIDIITMSPPPPTRATEADDGLPVTPFWDLG